MAETRLVFSSKVYRRSMRIPVRTSRGEWPVRDGILIRVEHEDGRVGFGEIAPLPDFGTETIAGAVAWCAGIGANPTITRLRDVPRGLPCCRFAMETALLSDAEPDASGRVPRLPVAALLPVGADRDEALARALDRGCTTLKLKIGTSAIAGELADVARLVDRLPDSVRLRLDANGGLDWRGAARWLDRAADWPVEFIEQPLPVGAAVDLVRLAADHAATIALDESVRAADDIKRWRDRGWPGVFVIKPALAGARDELVSEIRVQPDRVVFSSALESAIGTAAGVQLAFTAGVTRALGYGVAAFFEDDGLGGGIATPAISAAELAAWKPEAIWQQL